ncbi:MAG: phytoene/squalene synthase family protein, partial [Silanimonas sp.]
MSRHGRTFHLASLALGAARPAVLDLYRACRYIDDCVDAGDAAGGERRLAQMLGVFDRSATDPVPGARDAADDPAAATLRRLVHDHGVPAAAVRRLVDAVRGDAHFQAPTDEDDLLRYAFGVAGTVGLMMHPLLGCRDADSRRPAVALGVAMQLTN